MKYIVYKRFKERALCGEINLPALTKCEEKNGIIYFNDLPLCYITSENAHEYFMINEDGKGIERGTIIHNILVLLRRMDNNHQTRWNKIWGDTVSQKYKRHEHPDHWLWNHDFYCATLEDLNHIYSIIKGVK